MIAPSLIAAKIRAPSQTSRISRPRLEAHGAEITGHALTIVTAGAGFGKTTLLRAWARAAEEEALVAWLTLEPDDATIVGFAAYLDAALRSVAPDLGSSVARLIAEQNQEVVRYVAAFTNELLAFTEERCAEIVLFIDDFHTVQDDEAICALAGGILRALPPRLHLVIASRFPVVFSPINKLSADGRVAHFAQSDLRFTVDETAQLLHQAGIADASATTIERVVARTDGWAMALRLSAQTARRLSTSDLETALDSERSLFTYLAEEVLREQSPELRRALYACAVPPLIDSELIEVLTEAEHGRAVLDLLLTHNLYLEPADGERYRFHALFRDFLLDSFERDDPERLRAIRRRFANYLKAAGDLMGAVQQFLDAGDLVTAADHVAQAQAAIKFGERFTSIYHLLQRMPEDLKRERPRLVQFEAHALARMGRRDAADEAYARAIEYAVALEAYPIACACEIERGLLADDLAAGGHGTFERSLAHMRAALEYAQRCGERRQTYEKMAAIAMGLVHAARFEYESAEPYLRTAETLQLASTSQRQDIFTTIASIYGWQGLWQKALEYAELAEDLLRGGGGDYLIGPALKLQAKAHTYLRDDPPRAAALAQAAIDAELAQSASFDDLPDAYVVLARALLAMTPPDLDRARAALEAAQRRAGTLPSGVAAFEIAATRAELEIAAQRYDAAEHELALAAGRGRLNDDRHQLALTVLLSGRLARARGAEREAFEAFERASNEFAQLRDRFHAQVADLSAGALRAARGELTEKALQALVERCRGAGVPFAPQSEPEAASVLLAAAMRMQVALGEAEALFGPAVRRAGAETVVALALETGAPPQARISAIGFLAHERATPHRELFARLARDRDRAVAAAAATALRVLPPLTVVPLELDVVGPIEVRAGEARFGERDGRFSRRKAAELLRLLALADAPVPKASVVEALWPGTSPSSAESSLRVALHALRRALEPDVEGAGNYVDYDGTMLRLVRENVVRIDATEALAALRSGEFELARNAVDEAERAFTKGCAILEAAPGEADAPEWLRPHVQRWRDARAAALRRLARIRLLQGRAAEARGYLETLLELDPLDEEAVEIFLDVCSAAHDVERARAVFGDYKRRLASELAATPGPEVVAKYAQILASRSQNRLADLSSRELDVLRLIGMGKSNKEIASALELSHWTVNNHVARILKKLGVESRAAAVAAASGLIEP